MIEIPQKRLLTVEKKEPSGSLLPPEYQQVEYIVFTGTQYIDSNYVANASDKPLWVEIDFRLTSTTVESSLFGANGSNSRNPLVIDTDINRNAWRFGHYGDPSVNGIGSFVRFGTLDTNRHTIKYVFNEGVYFDGVLVPETVEQAKIVSIPNCRIFIGATSVLNVQANKRASMELCSVKFGETSGVVRNWIGGYNKENGTIGLYDTCNSVNPTTNTPFYINTGTGTFLKGADV